MLLGFIWLYVLIMSLARFRVNLHSIIAWISRTFLLETSAVPTWMFVYEISGCRLESCCSLQGLFLMIFFLLWSQEEWPFCPVFVFHRGMSIGILKYILYFNNEGLNISWISRYNSILGLKSGFHNTLFYSVSGWT